MRTVARRDVLIAAVGAPLVRAATGSRFATYSLSVKGGKYCFRRPDGKACILLGLSHADGAWWRGGDPVLTAGQKEQRLATLKRDLRDMHFNAVGYVPELVSEFAYIHNGDRLLGSPGIVTLNWQQGVRGRHMYEDVFDPEFKARLRKQVGDICARTAGDATCVGYWWTDIPVWNLAQQAELFGKTYVEFIGDLPPGAPGRRRYEEYRSGADASEAGFLVLIARELYRATATCYRELAPGRLLFGERYNTIPGAPYEIIAEAGKVVDIVSFQPYEKTLKGEILDKVHEMTGKPIFLSDWNLSFPVENHANTMWPQFPTEAEAAEAYEAYLVSAFRKPYILGYYKCQYYDTVLASGQLKQGLRTVDGVLYNTWAESITRIHRALLASFRREGRYEE